MERKIPTPLHVRKSIVKMQQIMTKLTNIKIHSLIKSDNLRDNYTLGRRITLLVEKLGDLTREAEFDVETKRGVLYTSETKAIMEAIILQLEVINLQMDSYLKSHRDNLTNNVNIIRTSKPSFGISLQEVITTREKISSLHYRGKSASWDG